MAGEIFRSFEIFLFIYASQNEIFVVKYALRITNIRHMRVSETKSSND